jgi:hypothetical protein
MSKRTSAAATVGCSVVTCGYLPYARVLAESFREHNPGADFAILLVDDHDQVVGRDEPFRVIRPEEIGITPEELDMRGLMYAPTELVCSLRPALLRHLLATGADAAILMDADGCVYGDLGPVADLARNSGTVLSPHFHDPHPPPVAEDSLELLQIRYGVMNGGFMAAGSKSDSFLEWLDHRLARHCLNAPERGLYLDQRWLDLAVSLFPTAVLRDPGCNVMCLNLQHRDVEWRGDRPSMRDGPLRYFHFLLAFDPEHPEHICDERFAQRWLPYLDERPGARRLAREYAQRLLASGYLAAKQGPQYYEVLPDGSGIDRHMRAAYRRGVLEAELTGAQPPPNPFRDGDSAALLGWLADEATDEVSDAGLSRYRRAIHDLRPDLVAAFPRVPGVDTERFLSWIDAESDGDWMRQHATGSLVSSLIAGRIPIDHRIRHLYREALRSSGALGTDRPPSPFAADTSGAFLAWLREAPHGSADGVSRYLLQVRAERAELVAAFPDVPGNDDEGYLAWLKAEASRPGVDVPRELLP